MTSYRDHYSEISNHNGNVMKRVFNDMSNYSDESSGQELIKHGLGASHSISDMGETFQHYISMNLSQPSRRVLKS